MLYSPIVIIIAIALLVAARLATRRRAHLRVAATVTMIVVLLAGISAVVEVVKSAGDAYGNDRVSVQLMGDAAAYYTGLSAAEVPKDPASPADPVIRATLQHMDRVIAPTKAAVTVAVHHPAAAGRITFVLASTLPPLLTAIAAVLVLLVLQNAIAGDPFSMRSVRHLRVLGWLLLLGLPFMALARSAVADLALGSQWSSVGTNIPSDTGFSLNFGWVLPGLVILAVAVIWQEGVRLRDADLTTV